MSKVALTSLAILKANWDKYKKSYTDNFVPLVAECIRVSGQPVVSLDDVRGRMLAHFGLRIPSNSLKVILGRVEKRGYLRREYKTYRPNPAKLKELRVEEARQSILKQHDATTQNLIAFCQEKYKVKWTEQEADDALLSYLKEHDLDIFLAVTEGTPIPKVSRKIPNAIFLVNSFARHVHRNDPQAFTYLENLVKGNLLANALVFPDVSAVTRKFRRTRVFLDTRLLLNALGYRGDPFRVACKDLLDLLYELGADLRCFRHTLDEVTGILHAIATALRSKDPAAIFEHVGRTFQARGATDSDVRLAITLLEKDLKRLHIEIEDKPQFDVKHQIDEPKLDGALQKRLGYAHDIARVRDVDSLSAIFRLRKGKEYPLIEECRALFVTTNDKLVRTANAFFVSYQSSSSTPLIINDHHLTNILWLKKPMTVPDLPRKQIIADSYAASEPSEELWRRFLGELSKLKERGDITAEDYLAFRSSLEASALLMDSTMGNPEAFVEATVPEIIAAYNDRVRAEAEAKQQAAEATSEKLKQQLQAIDARIESFAGLVGMWASRSLFAIIVLLWIIGSYRTLVTTTLPNWLHYLLLVGQIVVLVVGFGNLVHGATVKQFIRRVELSISRLLVNGLRGVLGTRRVSVGTAEAQEAGPPVPWQRL